MAKNVPLFKAVKYIYPRRYTNRRSVCFTSWSEGLPCISNVDRKCRLYLKTAPPKSCNVSMTQLYFYDKASRFEPRNTTTLL